MAGNRDFRLRLPPIWSRQARSAIVDALSLAWIALLAATDRVATSVRPEHELALLREVLRIKDARMERVPPRHRPHYPTVERLAILELRAARGWSASPTAERLFVTETTVASWMMRVPRQNPVRLALQEVALLFRIPESPAGAPGCPPSLPQSSSGDAEVGHRFFGLRESR